MRLTKPAWHHVYQQAMAGLRLTKPAWHNVYQQALAGLLETRALAPKKLEKPRERLTERPTEQNAPLGLRQVARKLAARMSPRQLGCTLHTCPAGLLREPEPAWNCPCSHAQSGVTCATQRPWLDKNRTWHEEQSAHLRLARTRARQARSLHGPAPPRPITTSHWPRIEPTGFATKANLREGERGASDVMAYLHGVLGKDNDHEGDGDGRKEG